ncbi:MAG TPA: hypothetical protein VG370_00515 [Chloroflexota bacterium]|jgi:hypothetical protein|nr:hypothetical protein [Chloroflexota bacterium]
MSGPERPVERPGPEVETGPVALSRLLDEIRADPRWREEVAALRPEPAGGEGTSEDVLEATLDALEAAIAAADRVVPIDPGRLVIGDAWARVRRQIHSEIRIYQDRQTVVNRQIAAALRRIAAELDPSVPEAAIAELWSALRRIEARLGEADALAAEIEPLGALRVAVAQLETRLAEVERWRAKG